MPRCVSRISNNACNHCFNLLYWVEISQNDSGGVMGKADKLELKIAELEKKLATKQAFLHAQISFPKGNRIPEEIKKQVSTKIREACTLLAEEQEISNNKDSDFTVQEIKALKSVAGVYLNKKGDTTATEPHNPTSPEDLQQGRVISQAATKMNRGRILMLDSVDPVMRKKIEPESEVVIIESREDMRFVQDKRANRFWINVEDLELI